MSRRTRYRVPQFRPSIAPNGLLPHLKRMHPDLWLLARKVMEMERHNKAVTEMLMHSDHRRYLAAQAALSAKPGDQVASATAGPSDHPAPQAGATESSDSAGVESEPRHFYPFKSESAFWDSYLFKGAVDAVGDQV